MLRPPCIRRFRRISQLGSSVAAGFCDFSADNAFLADPYDKMCRVFSLVEQDTLLPAQRLLNRWIA